MATIWDKVERTVEAAAQAEDPTASAPHETSAKAKRDKKERRMAQRRLLAVDIFASVAWLYVLTKLFVADIDRELVEQIAPNQLWVLDYRVIWYLLILVAVTLVIRKRKKRLFWIAYVLFFPLVVFIWKVPYALYRNGSWQTALGFLNFIAGMVRDFVYNVASKAFAVIAALLILTSGDKGILLLSTIYLFGLLLVSYVRTLRRALQPSWFLEVQRMAIQRVSPLPVSNLGAVPEKLKKTKALMFTSQELTEVASAMSAGIIVNRRLYFWAYQLNNYRRAAGSYVIGAVTYGWLLLGTIVTLALVNTAAFKIAPDQYDGTNQDPSFVAMLLYSASNHGFAELGDVSAGGDLAYVISLVTFFLGVVLALTVIANAMKLVRRQKDDDASKELVITLRERAKEQAGNLRKEYGLSVNDTLSGLVRVRIGMWQFLGWFDNLVPKDFLEGDLDDPPSLP